MREVLSAGRVALAGALALSVVGMAAGAAPAQAMPVAAAPAAASDALTSVAYDIRGHYTRGYRHNLRRFGKAGVYNCGPLALKTRLQKNACGTNLTARPYR